MKRILIILNITVLAGAVAFITSHWKRTSPPRPRPMDPLVSAGQNVNAGANDPGEDQLFPTRKTSTNKAGPRKLDASGMGVATSPTSWSWTNNPVEAVSYALDPRTSYSKRQEIWNTMRQNRYLDETMEELESRTQSEPGNPEIPANIGQLCLLKAGQLTNSITDQGILGMRADKMFDQALGMDPTNWEARYWKAMAMSYWPDVMNKSKEVMEHLVTLVEQQEARSPEPQFAQSYALLGQQYKKSGYPNYAREIWQRGLHFFPNDSGLRTNLASLNQ